MDHISEMKKYLDDVDIADLIRELESPFIDMRHKAHAELVAIGKEAINPLVALLHDNHRRLACEAAQILAEMTDPAGPRALVVSLNDDDPLVRWDATKELIRMENGGVVPLLEALEKDYHLARLRDAARDILWMLAQNHRLTRDEEHVLDVMEGPYPDSETARAARAALDELKKSGCSEPA